MTCSHEHHEDSQDEKGIKETGKGCLQRELQDTNSIHHLQVLFKSQLVQWLQKTETEKRSGSLWCHCLWDTPLNGRTSTQKSWSFMRADDNVEKSQEHGYIISDSDSSLCNIIKVRHGNWRSQGTWTRMRTTVRDVNLKSPWQGWLTRKLRCHEKGKLCLTSKSQKGCTSTWGKQKVVCKKFREKKFGSSLLEWSRETDFCSRFFTLRLSLWSWWWSQAVNQTCSTWTEGWGNKSKHLLSLQVLLQMHYNWIKRRELSWESVRASQPEFRGKLDAETHRWGQTSSQRLRQRKFCKETVKGELSNTNQWWFVVFDSKRTSKRVSLASRQEVIILTKQEIFVVETHFEPYLYL